MKQIEIVLSTQFQQHRIGSAKLPHAVDIEGLRDLLAEVSLSERDMVKEQEVLGSLYYEHYSDRYISISPAHKKTFSWVFNPANTSSEGKRLLWWLRQGRGVFWITGKPGSGKSTMMKFLCDDSQTSIALQEWACGKELAIVSHYFWWSGTRMQKSQEGLFRSILYGIFQRCPELIQKVCLERWAAASPEPGIHWQSRHTPWTVDELLTTISSIHGLSQLPMKFCIFIDGLDENKGDHMEMCKTIQRFGAASQDIKLCVASRPWNEFEQAFGGGQQLVEMHQLTTDDILEYTRARLTEHWAWTTMAANTCLAESLIRMIHRHAEGVFVWVVIVTQEVREGLSNYDSLEDLYRRVEGFPSHLGDFFRHILESVNPFYHEKMSTALQLGIAAAEPLELPVYEFHEQEYADSDYALKLPIFQSTEEAVEEKCKIMERRLRGWCKGLLQVQKRNGHAVQFLHRTVRDFLQTPELSAFLKTKAPVHFFADLSLIKAYTAWMKSRTFYNKPEPIHFHDDDAGFPSQHEAPFHWMTTGFLSAAHEVEHKQDQISPQILTDTFRHIDEFERSAVELENRGQIKIEPFEEGCVRIKYTARLFREHVFRHDLVIYLNHKVINEPGCLANSGTIRYGMNRYIETFSRTSRPYSLSEQFRKGIQRILESGEDPNEEEDMDGWSASPFATLLVSWEERTGSFHWAVQLIHMRLVSLFLKFGADPNASLNALGWNPCRVMIAIPLELESWRYNGETYIQELDLLFYHGADAEAKMEGEDEEVPEETMSAREWFFKELQLPLRRGLNSETIAEVALRLLQPIEDKAEAAAAWTTLKRALPRVIHERLAGVGSGGKRKRGVDKHHLERRAKLMHQETFEAEGKVVGLEAAIQGQWPNQPNAGEYSHNDSGFFNV